MSTAGGPKLHGIGRSGDSDIVLCVDAHDAGSYPGQPTTNYISSVTGWPGSAGVGYATPITLGEFGQLRNLAPIFDTYGLVPYTLSMEMKGNISGSVLVYMQNGSYTKYGFVSLSVNVTTEYQRFVFSNLTPNGPTAAWTANTPTDERAMLACYTGYGSGRNPTVKNIQLELGAYATPFVESRLPDPYAQGYNARPASTNLMIHGNVGTGQSFSDSSPSKHTITTVGNTTHSSAESKFSGGSVYFDGTGDKLTLASSTDWAVGANATIDCWVYPTDAYTTNHRLWSVVNNSSNLDGYIASNGYFYMHGGIIQANTQTVPRNVWTHIAVTYNSGAVKIYFNGASQSLAGTTTGYNISNTGTLHIGNFSSGSYYYAGYMDEFRITKGTALWTQSFTPPTRRNVSAPLVDLSGSDNGGNFATKDMTDVATYRDGQVIEPVASAVWDFDNTDDVITLGPSSEILAPPFNTVSVFAWVKLDSTSGWNGVFGAYSGGSFIHFQLYLGGISCYLYGPAAQYAYNDSGSFISVGEWTHIGFAYGSTVLTVYVNGEAMPTKPTGSTSNITSATEVSIGRVYASSRMFNGQIGNVQVYNTTLTDQQVKQNFNSQRSRFQV